jgi:hypothetical protein
LRIGLQRLTGLETIADSDLASVIADDPQVSIDSHHGGYLDRSGCHDSQREHGSERDATDTGGHGERKGPLLLLASPYDRLPFRMHGVANYVRHLERRFAAAAYLAQQLFDAAVVEVFALGLLIHTV